METIQTPTTGRQRPNHRHHRTRKYVHEHEVDAMVTAVLGHERNAVRDACFILMSYRHGLRIEEAVAVEWPQISFEAKTFHVKRNKKSLDSTQELQDDTLRLLRKLKDRSRDKRFVFEGRSLDKPLDTSTMRKVVLAASYEAELEWPVNPHALRHGCGFYLAEKKVDLRKIQLYLGHVNIKNTVIYTEWAGGLHEGLWD